ncbi:phage portal protein [Salipiger sp. 1_MG-2023]|uniref:phage portal protein n=1 Tax=Salipiger sp. 1_MG-2023 TaxID=3062665 RepID=UPI0026E25974|nr:phage portal protein [Salipiger sp. 1_MG-2023]MDO6587338.1 phage portal protein [Salipiger sp. 1_MG-2023]
MNLLGKIFGARETKDASPENKEDRIFFAGVGSYGSREFTSVAAALRAGAVIASGIGTMPLRLEGAGSRTDARLNELLNEEPHELMTAIEFREHLTMHAVFNGAGRAYVRRDAQGRAVELIPLHPAWCGAGWVLKNGEYVLPVSIEQEGISGDFRRDDILEVTAPRWDMLAGLDVTRACNRVLGLSRRLQDKQAKMSDTNAPAGVLFVDQMAGADAVKKIKIGWHKQFGESGIGVVDVPGSFTQMTQTASDQQLLDTMKFQVEEVGRIYGVHPYYLGQTQGSGAQGAISDVMLFHQVVTMAPWIERWEAALRRSVLKGTGVRANFDETALMRTTPQVRAEIYARALGSGGNVPWMTEDEVREGKNPFGLDPRGDDFWRKQRAGNEAPAQIPAP